MTVIIDGTTGASKVLLTAVQDVMSINAPMYSATGNGSTVNYTLSWTPGTVNALIVTVGGVIQKATTDYTLSGALLTFTTSPPNGSSIVVQGLSLAPTVMTPTDNTVDTAKLTVFHGLGKQHKIEPCR